MGPRRRSSISLNALQLTTTNLLPVRQPYIRSGWHEIANNFRYKINSWHPSDSMCKKTQLYFRIQIEILDAPLKYQIVKFINC